MDYVPPPNRTKILSIAEILSKISVKWPWPYKIKNLGPNRTDRSRNCPWIPGTHGLESRQKIHSIGWLMNWDNCSWKGQLERTRSWKVWSRKVWSWRVWSGKVGKLSNFSSNFPTSVRTFQLRPELFNFNLSNFISDFPTWNFPTSRSFQLPFPTTRIQMNFSGP